MAWFGADPGGSNAFGVALLRANGSFVSGLVSSADEALKWLETPKQREWLAEFREGLEAVGIDAPMWWSSGESGDRSADRYVRRLFPKSSGTVQTANSLRGAVLIQGVLLATRLRAELPNLPITEAHPKALLKALWRERPPWQKIAERFCLHGPAPDHTRDHERDALLAAVAAREGSTGRWTRDLALCDRLCGEQKPAAVAWAPVHYWWPEAVMKNQ